eukprot:Awhi_evm1s5704
METNKVKKDLRMSKISDPFSPMNGPLPLSPLVLDRSHPAEFIPYHKEQQSIEKLKTKRIQFNEGIGID